MRINFGGLILLAVAVTGCGKKQEVIFDVESISYKEKNSFYIPKIQNECGEISKSLKKYLNDGWRVVTSSPKERMVVDNKGTCVGTEYILEK